MIKSNVNTKDKNMGRKKSYADIVIHGNMRRHGGGKESSFCHRYKNYNVRTNLCSNYYDVSTWSGHKPSYM